MIVVAANDVDMQRNASSLGKGLEDVRDHFGGEVADLFSFQLKVSAEVGAGGDVKDGSGECLGRGLDQRRGRRRRRERGGYLVEGSESCAVAPDPLALAESLFETLSEGEGAVLCGVMVVDVQIPLAA